MLKDPSRLSKVVASMFDAVTTKVHVASAPCEADREVVEGGKRGEVRTL